MNSTHNLILIVLIFIGTEVKSQHANSKFYVKAYGGYGLLTPGSYSLFSSQSVSTSTTASASKTTWEKTPGLGAGLHYGGGVGIVVNKFLDLGVDAEYLVGKKITATYNSSSSSYSSSSFNSSNYSNDVTEVSHSVLSIIPNVTFKAISKRSYSIYTRLGIAFAINTKLKMETVDSSYSKTVNGTINSVTTRTGTENNVFKFKPGFGVQSVFGVKFRITQKLSGLAEVVGFFLASNPGSSEGIRKTKVAQTSPTARTSYIKDVYKLTYSNSGSQIYPSGSTTTGSGTRESDPISYNTSSSRYGDKFHMNYIGANVGIAWGF